MNVLEKNIQNDLQPTKNRDKKYFFARRLKIRRKEIYKAAKANLLVKRSNGICKSIFNLGLRLVGMGSRWV